LSVVGRTEQSVPPDDEYYWKHQWGTYQAKAVRLLTFDLCTFGCFPRDDWNIADMYDYNNVVELHYTRIHTARILPAALRAHISAPRGFAVRIASRTAISLCALTFYE
jgi:hypothetical protein